MRWFRRNRSPRVYWALDLEATGYDAKRDHVLSAGMVPIRNGAIRWGERWYQEVNPGVDPGSPAVTVHGLLPQRLAEAPPLEDLLPQIEERLEDATLVVHWGRLDVGLLRRAFRTAGRRWPRPRVLDTADLLHRLDRRRRLLEPSPEPTPTQLGEARAFLGLPPHEEHHALYDALATAELLLALNARLNVGLFKDS